ncbi:MAG TPA: ATP-binding cassette domain-containing protein [Polyangiaceae bacterium]|nr:ATP-binding cassette domain-containing protein [Polyangiaceae bacterium]
MVQVSDLTIGWEDVVLQEHATFDVAHGEIFAILGESGCGKSTLLRYLIGLEDTVVGSVTVAGVGAPHLDVGKPPFGVMFQSGALIGSLSVGENIGLPLEEWTTLVPEAIGAIVRAKLRLVGLGGTQDKLPSELSGGMKKRAAIARAMVLEPNLIFLDEPSAGLDPVSAVELDELILKLNKRLGLTVVVVTHELPSIFKIVSRCIMLDQGSRSIIAAGDPRALRDECDDPRVKRFFHRSAKEE